MSFLGNSSNNNPVKTPPVKPLTKDYLRNLQRNPEKGLENLIFSLKTEGPQWIREFIELGGIQTISRILETQLEALKYAKMRREPLRVDRQLPNTILVIKCLMQNEEGMEGVLRELKIIELIIYTIEYLPEHTKITTLHLLAAVSTLDEEAHRKMIPIINREISVFMKDASSPNDEVAAATLTFINATVINDQHNIAGVTELKHDFLQKGLGAIARSWKQRTHLAESMRTQIGIFERTLGEELSNYKDENYVESPDTLFEKLLEKTKGTPAFDRLTNILQYLLNVNHLGKGGFNKWDLVFQFVKASTIITDTEATNRESALNILFEKVSELEKIDFTGGRKKADTRSKIMGRVDIMGWHKASRRKLQDGESDDLSNRRDSTLPDKPPLSFSEPNLKLPLPEPPPPPPETIPERPSEILNSIPTEEPEPEPEPEPMPAPPPPPPPTAKGPSAPPPPPPLPGTKNVEALPKKSYTSVPSAKLKPFYWSKLPPTQLKGTIWATMKDDIVLDKQIMELEFGASNKATTKLATEESKTLILLDKRRWQNISIVLNRFQSYSSLDSIRDAIKNLDESISLEDLSLLAQYAPQPSEVEILKPYKELSPEELPPNLGVPEKFFLLLLDVPNIETRLKCWLFKENFTNRFIEIKQVVENLLRASLAVKKSTKFKRVLEVILAFGNFLNHNTNRGGCWGFKIKDLARIAEVKSLSDSSKSILYYIVDYAEENFPEDCDFPQELRILEEISHIHQPELLKEEISELKSGIQMIEDFIENTVNYGSFREVMSKFVPTSKLLVKKIDDLLERGQKLFKDMLVFFGESSSLTIDEFFGDIFRFSGSFEKTRIEMRRKKELEAQQKARQEEMLLRQKQKQQPVGRLERALAELSSGAYTKSAPKKQAQQPQQPEENFLNISLKPVPVPAAVAPTSDSSPRSSYSYDFEPQVSKKESISERGNPMTSSSRANTSYNARTPNAGSVPQLRTQAINNSGRTNTPRQQQQSSRGAQRDKLDEALAFLKK